MVIRAGGSDIAPPERFDLVWWQERGQRRFWCWRPIPPPGYASLGDVGTLSENPPSRGDVVCVAIGCLSANKQPLGEQIWNDRGGGAPKDGAFFAQPGGTGLFRCSDDDTHNRPRGEFYIPGSMTSKNSNETRGSGIDILSFNQGQPIRFRINNRPSSNDAWVGIYPANAGDHEHEDRWRWLRDIDVNNASLPGQAKGQWSIRVFSDGGYTLHDRVDFEITDDYKTEVWMQNVRIDDNRLKGLALEHPKHGTANVTTSPIVERTRQGDVNRFETYNTIYLVNDRDLQDEDVSGNSDREKINAELLMRAFQDQLQKKE